MFQRIHKFLAAVAALSAFFAHAADIDLFAGVPADGTNVANVMFAIDTGAAFNASNSAFRCSITSAGVVKTDGTGSAPTSLDRTNGGVEQCALYSVIQSLDTTVTKFNIGVMFFNKGQVPYNPATDTYASSSCVANNGGGCLVMPLTALTADTSPKILEWIRLWGSNNGNNAIQAPSSRGDGAMMQEIWAYYFGKMGISTVSYANYTKPVTGCGSNNIIWLGNNYNTQASPKDSTNAASSPLNRLQGTAPSGQNASPTIDSTSPYWNLTSSAVADTIVNSCTSSSTAFSQAVPGAENKGGSMLNWAGYLKLQGVRTAAIAVQGASCDQYYAAMMEKMGSKELGGGNFYKTSDFSTLQTALNKALGEIQAVNTAFAAVSLPVSVNSQGSYLNQIYVGMFRSADQFNPLWQGNLKQFKLGLSGSNLQLQDADSLPAINSNKGFITGCSRSFWTPNTADSYWIGSSGSTTCNVNATVAKSSNYPDGDIVEKGGHAYGLRAITPTNRTVYTCDPSIPSCNALTVFDASNTAVTQTALNNGGSDRSTLINWARGTNTQGELNLGTAAMRPTSHGDVLHSRPVPVNYGTDGNPSIVVYYGGNDGLLRAVNGNRGCTIAADGTCPPNADVGAITSNSKTYAAGTELWSFMPPEFYGNIKRLYDNTTPISYPGGSASGATPKAYGVDGPVTAFQGTISGNSKVYVYATMRRGGRVIYAFDSTVPGAPTLLWKKGCPNIGDDTGCIPTSLSGTNDTTWASIGQTWSSAKTLYATTYGSGSSPMLIMGGGYDNCEDAGTTPATSTGASTNHTCFSNSSTVSTKGNRVYVLDAATGAMIRSFPTIRAVVADVTVVKDSVTGKAKYAYTADMGGNVYRINFAPSGCVASDSSCWTITQIASLGCSTPAACAPTVSNTSNRKFMFAPSVVTTDNSTYYVLLGSGDREKPLPAYTASGNVSNYFFMLMDKPDDGTWLTAEYSDGGVCGYNLLCKDSLLGISAGSPPTDLGTKKGWYLGLSAREQVVTAAITLFGTTTFSTQIPQVNVPGSCTSGLGTTSVYNVSYLNAASKNGSTTPFEPVVGNGLPPSPVGGMVTLDARDGGISVPFCIGCSGTSPLESKRVTATSGVTVPKNRIFRYISK
ncbi:MAG: hypothetical protein RL392_695 [Pseudomonadota bacterium]|jgi:type IV pilus assembly protein PilY1